MDQAERVTKVFAEAARRELREAAERIAHCLSQLDDEDVWHRPADDMNAIGNLLLHLCGNLRQWVVSGVGGAEDTRDRPAEFAARGPISKADLLERLGRAVGEAEAAIAGLSPPEAVRTRHVQHGEQTAIAAVMHSVSHFVGHAQEIIHVTRRRLGPAYRFRGIGARSN